MDRLLQPLPAGVSGKDHAAHPLTWPPEFVLEITGVEDADGYRLRLTFRDGYVREIDFAPFPMRAVHPQIQQYREPGRSMAYRLEDGDLVWGEYKLCFSIADLNTGQL